MHGAGGAGFHKRVWRRKWQICTHLVHILLAPDAARTCIHATEPLVYTLITMYSDHTGDRLAESRS